MFIIVKNYKEGGVMGRKYFSKPAWALVVVLSLVLVAGAAHAALTIGTNFLAQTMKDLPALNDGYTLIPPDTDGAVGPDHIVELINGSYAVYTKTGGFVTASGLDDFWKAAGVTPSGLYPPVNSFDPRVVYDTGTKRWFASALDGGSPTNNFLLAVSNSSDPTKGWKGFSIDGAPDGRFTDFDTLGHNNDQVYLASNNFGASDVNTMIVAVPKASLLAGNIDNVTKRFENLNPDTTGYAIQPLIDPKTSGTELLYSDYNTPAGFFKRSQLLTTDSTPTLNTAGQLIPVTAYDLPPVGTQSGGTNNIDTGDNRFGSSVVRGGDGMVWGVQSVLYNGHAALRWFQIDPDKNVILQQGLIAKDGFDYYYGSIAVNSKGCVVIGFSGSSANTFISAYAVEGTTIAGVTTFGEALLLKAGTHSYDVDFGSGLNRWGDYSVTVLDSENENIFWTFQEWASDPFTFRFGLSDTWSTQITELICQPVPLPSTVLLFGSGLLGLVGLRLRLRKS
jgi:hypothetical protein